MSICKYFTRTYTCFVMHHLLFFCLDASLRDKSLGQRENYNKQRMHHTLRDVTHNTSHGNSLYGCIVCMCIIYTYTVYFLFFFQISQSWFNFLFRVHFSLLLSYTMFDWRIIWHMRGWVYYIQPNTLHDCSEWEKVRKKSLEINSFLKDIIIL